MVTIAMKLGHLLLGRKAMTSPDSVLKSRDITKIVVIKSYGFSGGGAKMAEEYDGETAFSPTNSWKEQLNTEQASQNNF